MMHYKENDKNKNLVILYKALLSEGFFEDEYLKELALLLFSSDIDEVIERIEGGD